MNVLLFFSEVAPQNQQNYHKVASFFLVVYSFDSVQKLRFTHLALSKPAQTNTVDTGNILLV